MLKALNILIRFYKRCKSSNMSAHAAELTFYVLLSIFPFLIFLFALSNYMNFDIYESNVLSRFLPTEVGEFITRALRDIQSTETSRSVLPLSILMTIWTASRGFFSIIRSLNFAYNETETRSYIHLRLLSLLYMCAFAFILITTFFLIIFGNKLLIYLMVNIPLISNWNTLISWLRYLFSTLLLFLFFMLIYTIVPNRDIHLSGALPGALFTTFAWIGVSFGFSLYVNLSPNLSYMYGSLAGIILIMLWLFIISNLIMLGGEINACYAESRTSPKKYLSKK